MDSTPSSNKAWFGADPGGINSFGVALLTGENQVHHDVVSSVDEAIEWLLAKLANTGADLCGAGIDAPMWFSSGKGGGRLADQRIRDTYGTIPAGTVQSVNSLQGAALAQGHMLALALRARDLDLPITEVHPKALIFASSFEDGKVSTPRFPLFSELWREWHEEAEKTSEETGREHRRDAILCAIAARESFDDSPRWTHDLTGEQYLSEQDPQDYCLAPMHYYWPEEISSAFTPSPAFTPNMRLSKQAWKTAVAPFIGVLAEKHSLSWRWMSNYDLTLEVTNVRGEKAEVAAGGIWFYPPLKPLGATPQQQIQRYLAPFAGAPCHLGKVIPRAIQQRGILPLGCALPVTPQALDLVLQEIADLL